MLVGPRIPTRTGTVRVFLLAFVVYAYFMPRWADWNIDSRIDLVHAIVDGRTLTIDRYHFNTWDKAQYDGHFFSDKAPGTAFLGVPVYGVYSLARSAPLLGSAINALKQNAAWNTAIVLGRTNTQLDPAAKGTNLGGCQRTGPGNYQYIPWGNRLVPPFRDWALSKYVMTFGVVATISSLFLAFLFWFLGVFGLGYALRALIVGLYGFATVALPYSTVFYSHEIAAACLFCAFALLYLRATRAASRWTLPTAGFLLGYAILTEYTVLVIVVVVGIYALWVFRRRASDLAWACAGGAAPAGAILAYNWACFGSPFDSGYSHDFCWSSAQSTGFEGFTYPHIGPLVDLTFGAYRGLFYMSPFLLFAVPGAVLAVRRRERLEAILCLVVGAVFILALSSYWGWNGGRVDGPRYLVPVVPFLVLPTSFFLARLDRRSAGWLLVVVASGWSLFVTWAQFLGGVLFPASWLRDPLVQYSLPELARNHIAPNAGQFLGLAGWYSLLPLVGLILTIGLWPSGRRGRASEAFVPALSS